MAASGSINTNNGAGLGSSYPKYLTFNWWQNGQSVDGNYTDIGWNVTLNGGANGWSVYIYSASVTVDGQTWDISQNGMRYQGHVLGSGTKRVYHNNDGSKSFSVSFGGNLYYSSGHWSGGSGSWGLNTIPRASQPSINTHPNNSPDFSIGDVITIHMNRASDSFTHKVFFCYGNKSRLVADGATFNCTFNTRDIADELYALIPNGVNYANSIKVETYSGGTYIGEKRCNYNARAVEKDIAPAFPSGAKFSLVDASPTANKLKNNTTTLFVAGQSNIQATMPKTMLATAQKSASISSHTFTIGGQSVTMTKDGNNYVGTITLSSSQTGNLACSITARDSRGYSVTCTALTAYVTSPNIVQSLAYATPTINATATRTNNFEDATTVKISGAYSAIETNTVKTILVKYRKSSAASWTAASTISGLSATNGSYKCDNKTLTLANTDAWVVRVEVADNANTSTLDIKVSKGVPIFRISTKDSLLYNNERPLMPSHVGQVIMSTTLDTAEKVKAIYGGIWRAWGAGRVPVGVNTNDSDFNTPNKTGGSKTVTLTLEQMPSHKHVQVAANSGDYGGDDGQVSGRGTIGANHQTSYSTMPAGGGKAHNNLQPYISVYMWLRTE